MSSLDDRFGRPVAGRSIATTMSKRVPPPPAKNKSEDEAAEESEDDSSSGETATDSSEESSEEDEELQPWRHHIFGCCDHGVGQCCALYFCGDVIYGNAISHTFHDGNCCCCFCCTVCAPVFSYCNRAKIRATYHLEGHNLGPCGECLTAVCCMSCSRCQQVLELETRQGRLYHVCGSKRGNPLRPANTGGNMSRGSNKVVPMTRTTTESDPLIVDAEEEGGGGEAGSNDSGGGGGGGGGGAADEPQEL